MICPKCGKKLGEDSKVCSACNESIVFSDYSKMKKSAESSEILKPINVMQPQKTNEIILIVAAVVIAIIFAVLGATAGYFVGKSKADVVSSSKTDDDENNTDDKKEASGEKIKKGEPDKNKGVTKTPKDKTEAPDDRQEAPTTVVEDERKTLNEWIGENIKNIPKHLIEPLNLKDDEIILCIGKNVVLVLADKGIEAVDFKGKPYIQEENDRKEISKFAEKHAEKLLPSNFKWDKSEEEFQFMENGNKWCFEIDEGNLEIDTIETSGNNETETFSKNFSLEIEFPVQNRN